MNLNTNLWEYFNYKDIFDIKKGFYNKKPDPSGEGDIPFLSAIDNNNGVSEYYTLDEINDASRTGDEKNDPLKKRFFMGMQFVLQTTDLLVMLIISQKILPVAMMLIPFIKKMVILMNVQGFL